jgi:hypothetical protein
MSSVAHHPELKMRSHRTGYMGETAVQSTIKKALVVMFLLGLVGSAGLLINLIASPGFAQEAKGKGQLPRLADLMNEAMQVHHAKLWFAGHANNWVLADYEVKKIKETIEEIKETIVDIQIASAQWQRVPVGELLRSIDSNLDTLAQAIKAKDGPRFDTAYRGLTAACNACHVRAEQPQIKIMVPLSESGSMFPNQDFANGDGRQ